MIFEIIRFLNVYALLLFFYSTDANFLSSSKVVGQVSQAHAMMGLAFTLYSLIFLLL